MKLPGGEGLTPLQTLSLYAGIFGGTAGGVNYLIQIIHNLG